MLKLFCNVIEGFTKTRNIKIDMMILLTLFIISQFCIIFYVIPAFVNVNLSFGPGQSIDEFCNYKGLGRPLFFDGYRD